MPLPRQHTATAWYHPEEVETLPQRHRRQPLVVAAALAAAAAVAAVAVVAAWTQSHPQN